MHFDNSVLLVGVTVIGIACQWLAWQLRIPAILPLLFAGILLGPVSGVLDPDALLGDLLFPVVSLAVAVILFEGALSLKRHELAGPVGRVVRNLVTVGALVTWAVMAVAARVFVELPWNLAILFGAVVVVTGPTVVVPLLRSVRPKATVSRVLRWEGIVIDPVGALLAVLAFEFIVSGQSAEPVLAFAKSLLVGVVAGAIVAWLWGKILAKHLLPRYLVDVATLAAVLFVFVLSDQFAKESGLLAVTVMGMVMANRREVPTEEIINFKESLSVMLISVLFVVLAARLNLEEIRFLAWSAVAVLASAILVARPLSVLLSTVGSPLSRAERGLIAWIAPRGIVAAAVSALFALRLDELGYAGAPLLVPLTFTLIIGTVIIQSLTAAPLAKLLKVAEPEPRGLLILGAHRVARAVGKALDKNGFPVVLADSNWDEIKTARMEGFSTYFGSAISEHADRNLELVGIGRLLAMTSRPAYNTLACQRFKHEFGAGLVYVLRTPEEKKEDAKREVSRALTFPRLFGGDVTLAKLSSLLAKGAEIRTTTLSESFDFDAYLKKMRHKVISLFAIDSVGRLRVFTATEQPKPQPGWKVISLLPAELVKALDEAAPANSKKEAVEENGVREASD